MARPLQKGLAPTTDPTRKDPIAMKPVNVTVLACAAVSFLLVFALPFISLGHGIDFTLWKLRNINPAESLVHPYIILVASAIPAVFAGLSLKNGGLARWQAIISTLCFAAGALIAFAVFSKTQTTFGDHSGIGAKLMLLSLVGGAGASIAAAVKPTRAPAMARG
jgi:hypothetical protein